jgi:hypothetical protein
LATKPSDAGNLLATEIGGYWGHIYVWSPGKQKPRKGERDCVLSAHGGIAATKGLPEAGDEILYFYCPHGLAMSTTAGTTGKIAAREVNSYEKKPLSQLEHDYNLTKFQGKHGRASGQVIESYNDIQHGLTQAARRAEIQKLIDARFIGATQEEKDAVRETDMDVVTIRHRKIGTPPTLLGLIKQLHAAGFHYRQIHCAFCRVINDKSPTWPITQNTLAPEP